MAVETKRCDCNSPMIFTARAEDHRYICPKCGLKDTELEKKRNMYISKKNYEKMRLFWIRRNCQPLAAVV